MPVRQKPLPRSTPTHFTLFSRNRVYGVFTSLEDVQRCTARLLEHGLGEQAIGLIMGDDGHRTLDADGLRHGMVGRWMRLLQGMTDERAHIEQYAHALGRGDIVLSVDVTHRPEAVARVCAAFCESGARFVNHYGRWVVEPITA